MEPAEIDSPKVAVTFRTSYSRRTFDLV